MTGHFATELHISTIPGRDRVRRLMTDLVYVTAAGERIVIPASLGSATHSFPLAGGDRTLISKMLLSVQQQIDYRNAATGSATALVNQLNVKGWRY